MILRALDRIEEAVAVVRNALEGVMDAVVLPRVLQHQHLYIKILLAFRT